MKDKSIKAQTILSFLIAIDILVLLIWLFFCGILRFPLISIVPVIATLGISATHISALVITMKNSVVPTTVYYARQLSPSEQVSVQPMPIALFNATPRQAALSTIRTLNRLFRYYSSGWLQRLQFTCLTRSSNSGQHDSFLGLLSLKYNHEHHLGTHLDGGWYAHARIQSSNIQLHRSD